MVMDKIGVKNFLKNKNLKQTRQRSGYFEQKITPDVLSFTAKCVIELIKCGNTDFTDRDLRNLEFFNDIAINYFSKPPQSEETENEYNKFTSYHLNLLEFSGVLKRSETKSRSRKYNIENEETLEFISQNDINALFFLQSYIEKFLKDNGLTEKFNVYKETPTQGKYVWLKNQFWLWAKEHTNVRGDKPTHTNRVFNKVFNIFAYSNSLPGESRSRVMEGRCPYYYLIYNRINFRDVNRPRGMSRREYYNQAIEEGAGNVGWLAFVTETAKRKIRERHPNTEILQEEYSPEENGTIQIHHIFPRAEYLEFASYLENLISLTSGQHFSHAHSGGTHSINERFQVLCLITKLKQIKKSRDFGDSFYDLNKFIEVINKGFSWSLPEDTEIETITEKLTEKFESLS
jgi:hypothetical protein